MSDHVGKDVITYPFENGRTPKTSKDGYCWGGVAWFLK